MAICTRQLRAQVQPDQLDETLRVIREEIVEFNHALPTYRGALAYGDPATGLLVTLSLWTDDGDQHYLSPADLVSYLRNRHSIDVKLLSVETFDLMLTDRVEVPPAVSVAA